VVQIPVYKGDVARGEAAAEPQTTGSGGGGKTFVGRGVGGCEQKKRKGLTPVQMIKTRLKKSKKIYGLDPG